MHKVAAVAILLLMLSGCSPFPSDTDVQTAIAGTESVEETAQAHVLNTLTAQAPTSTDTPAASSTPYPSPTPTPIPSAMTFDTQAVREAFERLDFLFVNIEGGAIRGENDNGTTLTLFENEDGLRRAFLGVVLTDNDTDASVAIKRSYIFFLTYAALPDFERADEVVDDLISEATDNLLDMVSAEHEDIFLKMMFVSSDGDALLMYAIDRDYGSGSSP